jgi:glycosyltransferase involved in cell wall biosynthesis
MRPQPLGRRPAVTVVIPCYNYGHYLPIAVGSVLEQPGVDVRVIVIDDASSDGSSAVARELASADDRVRAIVHETNRGHIATYNEGLRQAETAYVALLSADDALPAGSLARATALLEANPSVGLVYGHPITFTDDLPPTSTSVRSWTVWSGEEWIERRCRTGRNCIVNPEVLMRTSVQHAIGGYDPELPHSGDFEMWLRAASVSDIGRVNGSTQGLYRIHASSMQRTTYAGHAIDLEGRLDAFEKLLIGPQAQVANGEALLATAKRALALLALGHARSAYAHGRAGDEPVDEYLAFAVRMWPSLPGSRKWRAMMRRASADACDIHRGLEARSLRLAEDLRWRVRWRRWRWTGV